MLYAMSGYYKLDSVLSCFGQIKRLLRDKILKKEFSNHEHLINNVRCETHRWVQSRIYELSNHN